MGESAQYFECLTNAICKEMAKRIRTVDDDLETILEQCDAKDALIQFFASAARTKVDILKQQIDERAEVEAKLISCLRQHEAFGRTEERIQWAVAKAFSDHQPSI
jgi:hypothetical protein